MRSFGMKKWFTAVLVCVMAVLSACCAEEAPVPVFGDIFPPRSGAQVAAVFAASDIQPFLKQDGDQENLDSVWVYYTDGTFEQFAEVNDQVLLFSSGTHEFVGDADFIYENPGEGNGEIIIRRAKKLTTEDGMQDYTSEHTYQMGTLGYTQLYAPENPDRQIVSVFYGLDKQPYLEEDGEQEMLDTWWIYYSDGSFEQFAIMDDPDTVVLFSEGRYQLGEGSSFVYEKNGSTPDKITLQRTKKYVSGSLVPYDSVHEYELGTLGLIRIVAFDD